MLRLIIILGIIILFAVFLAYSFFTYFLGISGTRSVFDKDLDRLIDHLRSIELVPWKMEELDLLTRNGHSQVDNSLFMTTETGVIHSIYEEPILAYAYRRYRSNGIRIIAVRINDDIIHYRLSGKKIFVYQNGEELGALMIKENISFLGSGHSIEIEHLDRASQIPLKLGGKKVMTVQSFSEDLPYEGRILEPLEEYTEDQARFILATLAYAIVDEQI